MGIQFFKKLYKKTATGAIQEWLISVEDTTIVTVYGQVGGKLQTTTDVIKSGKNLGRKNATDRETQAFEEAQSRWLKKKKSGYVESRTEALAGKVDSEIVEGGIVPMTAKVFEDYQESIKYPVAVQPKLDGHRCIAAIDINQNVTLWTRTRKRITSVPHIEKALKCAADQYGWFDLYFDGELYNHDLKENFEELTSIARKKNPGEGAEKIQYHIYDMVHAKSFIHRFINNMDLPTDFWEYGIHVVETWIAENEEEVMDLYDKYKREGYEGVMVRDLSVSYEHKRTDQLLKLKGFMEEEFSIVDVEEGRGRLAGHAGAFVCHNPKGVLPEAKVFRAKLSGNTKKLKYYWENRFECIGKLLTVKFQNYSLAGVPRFPVGIRLREDL